MLQALPSRALSCRVAPLAQSNKPTVVLVHGAFADSSSWNGVARILQKDGYRVVAVANPLRSVSATQPYVSDVVASIDGPVVLVGPLLWRPGDHDLREWQGKRKVAGLCGGLRPDEGDAAADLAGKFPGGTLGQALAAPVKLADGNTDLSIDQEKFHDQFAHDVSVDDAALMAAGQRPITEPL